MPHMVVFRTKEGKPGYHLADTLDDAVRFVEHLRNNEQVADSKVYRMHEVPIEFKVLYKVEVAPGTGGASPAESAPPNFEGGTGSDAASNGPAAPMPQARLTPSRDTGEPVTAAMINQPRTSASAPTTQGAPVAQGGGRFGLFSRS
jgi:hypothetical protein